MFVPFNQMPETSRIWIYQADRFLTEEEVTKASDFLSQFVQHWESHGNQLQASYDIREKLFIIIAVNESHYQASGCSIDKSVQAIKEIEKFLDVNFFDRTKVAYCNNQSIQLVSLLDLKKMIKEGQLTKSTHIFNNLVDTKKTLERNWKLPAEETWIGKFFQ
ncbi:MAG TPA: hypothetical protein VIK89_07270 [Cytophagaceae bacterium]